MDDLEQNVEDAKRLLALGSGEPSGIGHWGSALLMWTGAAGPSERSPGLYGPFEMGTESIHSAGSLSGGLSLSPGRNSAVFRVTYRAFRSSSRSVQRLHALIPYNVFHGGKTFHGCSSYAPAAAASTARCTGCTE